MLRAPYSWVSSSAASYWVTNLLKAQRPGSSDQCPRHKEAAGEGAGLLLQQMVCLGFFKDPGGSGRRMRTVQPPQRRRSAFGDLRAVTVLLRTSLPAIPFPLLFPRSPSFFLFDNPGCIVPLTQTICVLALISSNKGGENRSPLGPGPCPASPGGPGRREGSLGVAQQAGPFRA